MTIEAVENEVRSRGEVRDYGIYEDSDDSDTGKTQPTMSLNAAQRNEVANVVDDDEMPGKILQILIICSLFVYLLFSF